MRTAAGDRRAGARSRVPRAVRAELQLLISADALWENGFGVVFPELEGVSAFDDVRATLDRLSILPVRSVIPGHGSPFEDIVEAIDRAHRRLDAFVADPMRHAQHAAKVLIKFHLLDVKQVALAESMEWLNSTPYMRLAHQRHFDAIAFEAWSSGLLTSLIKSEAIYVANGVVSNA